MVCPGASSRPNDRLPGTATDEARADCHACTRPAPMSVAGTGSLRSLFFMARVAWFMFSALMRGGDQFGWIWRSSVATPDTCGADMDVPDRTDAPVPVPTAA